MLEHCRHIVMRRLLLAAVLFWLPSTASAQVVAHTVTLTTDSGGDVTAYTPTTFGEVLAVRYVPDASTPLATGADITLTDSVTGLQVLAITNIGLSARDFLPRAFTVDSTGANALYAAAGSNVLDRIPVANPIKVVVAQGGNVRSGTLYIYVQGR